MRFYVYQGITTLINSDYQNRDHAWVVATNLKQRRLYNLTMSYGSSFYWLDKNLTNGSNHGNGSDMTNGQDKWWDNWKSWEWNDTSGDSYLQDLSIKVNPKVTEGVVHHASLWVNLGLHLRLHMCKDINPSLESSDPFHRMLSLVNPITDVLL
jgi:hypothetical protein